MKACEQCGRSELAAPACEVCAFEHPQPAIQAALDAVDRGRQSIELELAELVRLLRECSAALARGDREEAAALLTEAADIEWELGIDGVGDLFESLGLTDGAEGRLSRLCTSAAADDSEFCDRHRDGMPVPDDFRRNDERHGR